MLLSRAVPLLLVSAALCLAAPVMPSPYGLAVGLPGWVFLPVALGLTGWTGLARWRSRRSRPRTSTTEC